MSILPWLADASLHSAIDELTMRANDAKEQAQKRILKNTIDPFASMIIAHTYKLQSLKELQTTQESASAQSGISSAVGNFHQEILGSISGWTNHDAGYDLENVNKKIVAEVKNKHNTMNASNKSSVLRDLDTAVRQKGNGWEGYLVVILPRRKKRFKKRKDECNRPVYEIDGASFYTLATDGVESALHDLYKATKSVLLKNYSMPNDIADYCNERIADSISRYE